MLDILVIGRDGQVGWELQRSLQAVGRVCAPAPEAFDLAQPESLRALLRQWHPHLIVNAAAYTAVDRAETESDLAMAINARSVGEIASHCAESGVALIHYSTDYVYDGRKATAWVESDPVGPLSVYGRSKLEGDRLIAASGAAHAVLRTSWVYGARGQNFARTMLRLAREREQLRVIDDQWGAPTWSRSLADATATLVARAGRSRDAIAAALHDQGGVFHLVSGGATTWFSFAEAIFAEVPDAARRLRELVPITTADYPTPATRPANSRLDTSRIAAAWGIALPDWRDALRLCAADLC